VTRPTSRLLEVVHETARGLDKAGFIDKRRMREHDALCLEAVPEYPSGKIRALRVNCTCVPDPGTWV